MTTTQKYQDLRNYIETKYGSTYMAAMAKLSVANPFDNKGILKSEFKLTSKEKDALLYYIPELNSLDNEKNVPLENKDGYEEFLNDVRKNTIKSTENSNPNDNVDVTLDIVGVEFLDFEIEEKYGEDIYQMAHSEVPATEIEGSRMFNRDFAKAKRKLGHIIHEGISASPLMDLDIFMEALDLKGIPSYIDYENNVFHYNAKRKTFK